MSTPTAEVKAVNTTAADTANAEDVKTADANAAMNAEDTKNPQAPSPPDPVNVLQWTPSDVKQFVLAIGPSYSWYATWMENTQIDGRVLLQLQLGDTHWCRAEQRVVLQKVDDVFEQAKAAGAFARIGVSDPMRLRYRA